jgi:DNA-binding LacI/PurR family transcriptional regulator
LKDVAVAAGVSPKTVSRVINRDPNVKVAKRERVLAAISALDFRLNMNARALRRRKTDTIVVYIGHDPLLVFSNPLFGEVLAGISLVANRANLRVVLTTDISRGRKTSTKLSDEPSLQNMTAGRSDGGLGQLEVVKSILARVEARNPFSGNELATEDFPFDQLGDGMILMSIHMGDPLVVLLSTRGFPVVMTCRYSVKSAIPFVEADNERGGYEAAKHLVELGHRVIGVLAGPRQLWSTRARVRGFVKALKELGVPSQPQLIVHGDLNETSGYDLAKPILGAAQRPTALFCNSDLIAIGALRAAREYGLRVPRDLSVIGFDDIEISKHTAPPLTTIRQPSFEKGVVAADMLITAIRGEPLNPSQVILPIELMRRGSTAPAPGVSGMQVAEGA